jgi:hypothetical protein
MKYAIHDGSGPILRLVSCPEDQIEGNVRAGELCVVVDNDVRDSTHWIDAGVALEFATKPSVFHIFDYSTKQWIDPRTAETQWVVVRTERNKLLVGSDWTQMPDAPDTAKAAWAIYRQALRDVPAQADPFNIVWPVAP